MSQKSTYIIDLDDQFSPGLKKAKSEMSMFDQAVSKTSGVMTGMLTSALITAGVAAAAFAGRMVTLGAEMEQTQIAMQVMVGDVEKANELFDQMNQFANITPFSNKDITDSGKLLLSFGTAAEDIMPTLAMLGDVSGGNSEKLRGMSLAFAQMSSTGRLMGQDLLQMINSGFNPLKQISQDTGISMGELKKKMEQGAISADMVKEAFVRATSEGGLFFGMMDKQAKTISGQWSTVMGTIEHMMAKGGMAMGPFINKILGGMVTMLDTISRVDLSPLTYTFSQFWDILTGVFGAFADLFNMIFPATDGMKAFQGVMDGIALTFRVLLTPMRFFLEGLKIMIKLADNFAMVWKGVGEMILGAFTFDGAKIQQGFQTAKNAIRTGFGEVTEEVQNFIKAEGEGWRKVFLGGTPGASEEAAAAQRFGSKGYDFAGAAGGKNKKSGVDGEVRSGGVKNITINIQNLVKEITFQKLDKLSESQVVEIVKKALLTAVNDANLAV